MNAKQKRDETAAQRFQLIAPLLQEGLDASAAKKRRLDISEASGLSERTLRRYVQAYREQGYEGLVPNQRKQEDPENPLSDVLEQAILLRREVPSRSVAQIIQILEWEGFVQKGELKRSTLQEQLTRRGYSSRQMKMYHETAVATRRFQRRHRNQLWHSDIKYGPYLPIGPNGQKKQVYFVAMLDDATRFVLHAAFYPMLDARCIEDAFRQSIQKNGVPETVYFDNGKQYKTKWMKRTCSKLGTRLLYAKPYSPESTGKIERFNRLIDAFLAEADLEKPQTLDELNRLFVVWMEECYQNQPHSGLDGLKTPNEAFRTDRKPLRMVSSEQLANAFLHSETRKVDKSGCISFQDRKYEVGISYVGCKVEVVYDPSDISELQIEYENHTPWRVTELSIGERTEKRPSLPERMTKQPAAESRLLKAAAEKNEKRQDSREPAISFRLIQQGGEKHV